MPLEPLTGGSVFIDALVPTNPAGADDRREGDDHIRGVKNVLKNTFPNINAAVTASDEQINALNGGSAGATFAAGTAAAPSIRFTAATTSGFYSPGADQVGIATAGLGRMTFAAAGNITVNAPSSGITLVTNGVSLGAVAGNEQITHDFGCADGNSTRLTIRSVRISNGSSHDTSATRISRRVDSSDMGFIDFRSLDPRIALGLGSTVFTTWSTNGNVTVSAPSGGVHTINGTVTRPNQPSFNANTSAPQTSGTVMIFGTENHDVGSNYNNATGVFTAPVAGRYLVCASVVITNTSGGAISRNIIFNFSTHPDIAFGTDSVPNAAATTVTCSHVVQLAASETVEVNTGAALTASVTGSGSFSAHLLG